MDDLVVAPRLNGGNHNNGIDAIEAAVGDAVDEEVAFDDFNGDAVAKPLVTPQTLDDARLAMNPTIRTRMFGQLGALSLPAMCRKILDLWDS
jgi:hypothetical protein